MEEVLAGHGESRPSSYYKYVSESSARAILENRTLKFSRPALFNDEFDMRVNLDECIDKDAAIKLVLDGLWEAQSALVYDVHPDSAAGRWISAIRARFPRRSDRTGFDEYMRPTVEEFVVDPLGRRKKFYEQVHGECSRRKALCLSASATVGPMWGLYADSLRGAVFEFAPVSHDSIFLAPRQIEYITSPPSIFTTESVVEMAVGKGMIDHDRLHQIILFTKSAEWSFEQEWRMVAGDGWAPLDEVEYIEFQPNDLVSVIFGTRASSSFCDYVARIVNEKYESCRLRRLIRPSAGMDYVVGAFES